jgi:HAMP domain-containing protein
MHGALLISIGVLACLAAVRVWLAYRLGELRHVRHHSRQH